MNSGLKLVKSYFIKFSLKDLNSLEKYFSKNIVLQDWSVSKKGIKSVIKHNKELFVKFKKIRINKALLKQHKYATLTHIENQLLNEQRIDIKTFFSLCVLEKMNVFYIHKKTYYDLQMNKDDNNVDANNSTFILYSSTNPKINNHQKYGFELGISEKIEKFKNDFFHVENLEKPIKAISAYKLNELLEYCKRLGIETTNQNNKTKNKKELYESLIQYF